MNNEQKQQSEREASRAARICIEQRIRQLDLDSSAGMSEANAFDHHTRCLDCGRFVDKSRWVRKDSVYAQRGGRPLCRPCGSKYDNELY